MEPTNSVLAGLKMEFDVAEDPQENCAYNTDDARRSRRPDLAAISEQPSGAGFGMFGQKVKIKMETPDPDLAVAEDPFMALNLRVKKEPLSDETSDNVTESRRLDHSGSNHAAVSEQSSGAGFGMFELKVKLKMETPDPDLAEAEDPFTALNLQVKKEPVSDSGDETSDNVTEGCDVSNTDQHFMSSNSDLDFDNGDSNTNNRKGNNEVLIDNQVSKASKEDTSKEFSNHQEISNKCLKCNICGKDFTWLHDLKRHQRIHTGDRPYQCSDCSKAFRDSHDLKRHQRIHTGDRPYQCTDCSKAFKHSHELKRHQRVHTRDKPYKCTDCGKAFSVSQNLKVHQSIHAGDKPYKCMECHKAFSQLINLKRHQGIHKGDKPYQCTDCCKTFRLSHHLKRHQLIHMRN